MNQEAWLQLYIDIKTEPGQNMQKTKKNQKIIFFKLIKNVDFEKNCRKYKNNGDYKLKTTEARRNYLMREPNYHTRKNFPKDYQQTKTKNVFMNKPVYSDLSISARSKMYELWYDYAKPIYEEN